MNKELAEILKDREKTHGDFREQATTSQRFKGVLRNGATWQLASVSQQEALEMICHKIARIAEGNPNYIDHWVDIAGYATLVANQLKNELNQ